MKTLEQWKNDLELWEKEVKERLRIADDLNEYYLDRLWLEQWTDHVMDQIFNCEEHSSSAHQQKIKKQLLTETIIVSERTTK